MGVGWGREEWREREMEEDREGRGIRRESEVGGLCFRACVVCSAVQPLLMLLSSSVTLYPILFKTQSLSSQGAPQLC